MISLFAITHFDVQKANAFETKNSTAPVPLLSTTNKSANLGTPIQLSPPPIPPIPSSIDNQTMITAALDVPGIKSWSDKWQYAGMDFNGTGNPVVWKHAIVLLYSPPDANTPLKCANGWTARVQIDLSTKQVLHAWYPNMQSLCTGYAELKKTNSSNEQIHPTASSNAASLTPSIHIGTSEATEQDVTSGQWYGNEAFFPTPSYSSNIFQDMNGLVGFSLNDNFNTGNGFTQAGWTMTSIPGCGGCNLAAGTAALVYVDESISGAGDAAYNIGYSWVNGQNLIAEVICNTSTSKYDIDITYGSTYSHHTNISCSTYQANDIDNNSIWFENQNTIQSSLWSGDITSSISASHAYKFDYQGVDAYSWSSSNDFDRTAGIDQTSTVMTGNVASFGTATWSSLANIPLFTDPNTIFVSSKDTSFNPHQGMGVVISPGGSSSTPALFEGLTSGQSYNVTPQDYGGYYFDYWRYSGDSVVPKPVTAGSTVQTLVPVYSTTAVQIKAQDQNGNPLSLYTTLYNSAGSPIRTGYTPITFGLNYGQTYSVTVADYNPYYFNYWDDDHTNQVRQRSFAVYGVLQTYTADFSTTSVHVSATDTPGNPLIGLYVPLSQGGNVIRQGYTPADFGLDSGQTYSVAPNDYGSNYFNHWHDSYDSWDGIRARTVNLPPSTSQAYTSVYYSSPAQGFEITGTDWNLNPLTGFYVPISPCGGDNQCSAFMPAWFTYLYGSSYTVTPNDYGNYYFDHWYDGSTTRAHSFTPSTSLPAYNVVYRTCYPTHCYAIENGDDTSSNSGNQFDTTITNIQASNSCNYLVDVEQWDRFPNGDWVENGFTSGNFNGACKTTQESFHAYKIIGIGYQAFDDGTVSQNTQHNYMVKDTGQQLWNFYDNSINTGSITATYDTAAYAQAGAEVVDPQPSIPQTSQSNIQYLSGSTWTNWGSSDTFPYHHYPPVWISNCSDFPFQHINVGTGTQGSC